MTKSKRVSAKCAQQCCTLKRGFFLSFNPIKYYNERTVRIWSHSIRLWLISTRWTNLDAFVLLLFPIYNILPLTKPNSWFTRCRSIKMYICNRIQCTIHTAFTLKSYWLCVVGSLSSDTEKIMWLPIETNICDLTINQSGFKCLTRSQKTSMPKSNDESHSLCFMNDWSFSVYFIVGYMRFEWYVHGCYRLVGVNAIESVESCFYCFVSKTEWKLIFECDLLDSLMNQRFASVFVIVSIWLVYWEWTKNCALQVRKMCVALDSKEPLSISIIN